jgi:hypothetical protein
MGRVGETINTLHCFILDVIIEAEKSAWIDLLLEHLHLKTLNNSFILEYNYSLMITVPKHKRHKSPHKHSKTIYVFTSGQVIITVQIHSKNSF